VSEAGKSRSNGGIWQMWAIAHVASIESGFRAMATQIKSTAFQLL